MSKTSRTLFLIVGCIMAIFIGSLHTLVHFSDLLTPEIFNHLQKEIPVNGETQIMWNTWGVISFMMGVSFILIGILNLSIWLNLSKTDFPPILALLAMIIYQLCVVYVGVEFNAIQQFYGGIVGGILMLISLIITLTHKKI